MNSMQYTVKQDSEALDLSNRPQHLLSPSIDNEDDDEYIPSDYEQHNDTLEANDFLLKVICYIFVRFCFE